MSAERESRTAPESRVEELEAIYRRWSTDYDRGAHDYTDAGCRVLAEHAFRDIHTLLARCAAKEADRIGEIGRTGRALKRAEAAEALLRRIAYAPFDVNASAVSELANVKGIAADFFSLHTPDSGGLQSPDSSVVVREKQ